MLYKKSMGLIEDSIRQTTRALHRSERRTKRQFDNSIAKTKRVINRTNNKIENRIKHAGHNIEKVFTEDIPKGFTQTFTPTFGRELARGLSVTFGTADRVLSAVTNVGDKIFDIPILGNALKIAAPEFYELNQALKIGEIGAKGMAGLTDLNNYKNESGKQVVKTILERVGETGVEEAKAGAFDDGFTHLKGFTFG
jgi:hypothetical protein